MSKTITLSIGERVAAIKLLNVGKFSNSTLAVVLDDIKKIAMSEQEWKDAKLTKSPSDEEIKAMPKDANAEIQQTWNWTEADKAIELGKETVDVLLEMIKQKSEAKEMTLGDSSLVTLENKLK